MRLHRLKPKQNAALYCVFAMCCAALGPVHAQLMPPNLAHLNSDHGLSQNWVNGIAQDGQGYIWLATQSSLNRFDGHDIQVYTSAQGELPLASIHITTLATDAKHRLWFGTLKGLYRLDPKSRKRRDFRDSALAGKQVTALRVLAAGSVLVGTRKHGLFQVDDQDGVRHLVAETGCSGAITAIVQRDDSHTWVATDGSGLCLAEPSAHKLHPLAATDRPLPNHILALARGADGSLWLGGPDGLLHLNGNAAPKQIPLSESQRTPREVLTLYLDRQQGLWVGTRKDGAYLIRNGRQLWHFRHVPGAPGSLASNEIDGFFEDDEGVLWIGTRGGGVDRLYPRLTAFSHISSLGAPYYSHLGGDHVFALLLSHGEYWVGTRAGGVDRIHSQSDQVDSYPPGVASGLPSAPVSALAEDSSGTIWAGTQGGGLLRFDVGRNRFTALPLDPESPDGIPSADIFAILANADGSLWLGTEHGLCRFSPAQGRCYNYHHDPRDATSLPDEDTRRLYRDRAGTLWLGFRNAGLAAFDGIGFRHFHNDPKDPASLSDDEPLAFREDAQGRFWVGTTRGLNLFDRRTGTAQRFTRADGLPDDTIYAIIPGAEGLLWLSTNRGLSRFDPAQRRFLNFGPDDGLPMTEFNVGAWAIGPGGYLFFGGVRGLLGVSTRNIHIDNVAPRPVISAVHLRNASSHLLGQLAAPKSQDFIEPQGKLQLPWQTRVITLDFTGLHFQNPLAVRYQYRLLGLNDSWVGANSDERRATFIALPPGEYHFQIRAANGDGVWSAQPAELTLSIPPAPWRTPWAYAAYLLLLGWLAHTLLHARWQSLRQKRRMQAQIAAAREQLQIALQAGGGELFDWNLPDHAIHRINTLAWAVPRPETIDPQDVDSMRDRIHPADFDDTTQAIKSHLEGRSASVDTTYRLRTQDGNWRWVTTRAQVVERNGEQALRIAGTTTDVDQLKRAQAAVQDLNEHLEQRVSERTRELRQTLEELAEAKKMASLGKLVAGVAHEINTPLGIAVTATSFLEKKLAQLQRALDQQHLKRSELEAFCDKSAEGLALSLYNLERAAELIRNFKQVAVDQTGEQARQFDMGEYLNQIRIAMKPQLHKGQHALTLHCPPGITCHSYPGALWQVINNLVMNSILHGFGDRRQGEISIQVQATEEHIFLIYRDNGCGMEDAVLERIFEPFFTTRHDTGGSGLGMHIVFNLVTAILGGAIQCSSTPKQGICCELQFPRQRVADPAGNDPTPAGTMAGVGN